mmetsp:Transcript_17400/g.29734  ORF Transcript_17400/g.29734 Transcript_17400/m.29734 type:complete len:621 (+) Transcript_17400:37-1899(+)
MVGLKVIKYPNMRSRMMSGGTFRNQCALDRLPLPGLRSTLEKYVETAAPYLSKGDDLDGLVADALEDVDLLRRQRFLESRAETRENWLSDFWTSGCYMRWRAALPINSNVTGYLFGEFRKRWDQVFSASAVTHGALRYHVDLLNGVIEPNMAGGKLQCMDQYSRAFSLTRIPGIEEDHLVKYSELESGHIIVIAGNRLYRLQVVSSDRVVIPLPVLYRRLSAIKEEWKRLGDECEYPVAVLTATERTKWSKVRTKMLGDVVNGAALNEVESALFCISLESGIDETDSECALSCCVGNGRSTWFDKSFQLKFKEDGNPSINIEHSWADAPVPLDIFYHHALPYAESLDEKSLVSTNDDPGWAPFKRLDFNVSQIADDIKSAEKDIDIAISDTDVSVYRSSGVGKTVWKEAKISPDAACQMALQLAYRRMTGSEHPVATYETIGMVHYLEGRTECCRVVSKSSEAFVKHALQTYSKTGSESDRLESERLLRIACKDHIKYIVDGQKGEGVDRHLFALRLLSKDGSQPKLFQHPSFEKSGSTGAFILSTSNNSYINRPFGGLFGATMPNGYGVVYIPYANEIISCVESKHSCKETDSLKFQMYFDQSLRDIARICGVQPTSKL